MKKGIVVETYAARVAFLWDQLSVTEGRERMILAAEMAERLSLVLGRHVDSSEFLKYTRHRPENDDVLEAMAWVLKVDVGWLTRS